MTIIWFLLGQGRTFLQIMLLLILMYLSKNENEAKTYLLFAQFNLFCNPHIGDCLMSGRGLLGGVFVGSRMGTRREGLL